MKNSKFLLVILFSFLLLLLLKQINFKIPISSLAQKVVSRCKMAQNKDVCYETEIPKLTRFLSMEDAFLVTEQIQQTDISFPYCHVLGHKLASIETKKDPTKWKDVVARCPRGTCSNGCVHGAFQEKYKNESLSGSEINDSIKEFETICEESSTNKLTGLEQGSCYHALGHLLMYITTADINKSLSICNQISVKNDGRDFTSVCYAGAFMQIFQPLDTDDISLVSRYKLNKDNAWDFCGGFKDLQQTKCREESWPLYLSEISTADGLIKFCGVLDSSGKSSCLKNVLYLIPIQFRFNINAIKTYCLGFSGENQGLCFAMTASRILEIDKNNAKKAIDFCSSLDAKNSSACFNQILKDAVFDYGVKSTEYANFCNLVPDEWKDKCLTNEKN